MEAERDSLSKEQKDTLVLIPLSELHPFPNHPFSVRDDAELEKIVESVRNYGVVTPAVVRPRTDGGYEIIAGHRRKRASELAGLDTLPCMIRDLDEDTAIILMVDSNLQRENVLPSEKARAYKMKLDAIKRQGRRTDLTSAQVGQKSGGKTSRELIAKESADSSGQIQRYIRLTKLTPELQRMADDKKLAFTSAVELSYLTSDEQSLLNELIKQEELIPSLVQAQRMKKLSQSGVLDADAIRSVMLCKNENTQPESTGFSTKADRIIGQNAESATSNNPMTSHFNSENCNLKSSGKMLRQSNHPLEESSEPGERRYSSMTENIAALKDVNKDCSCTPAIFMSAISEYISRFQCEFEWLGSDYYTPVFPVLTPEQVQNLQRQMDSIKTAVDHLMKKVKGMSNRE